MSLHTLDHSYSLQPSAGRRRSFRESLMWRRLQPALCAFPWLNFDERARAVLRSTFVLGKFFACYFTLHLVPLQLQSSSSPCTNGFSISSLPSTGEIRTSRVPRATRSPNERVLMLPSSSARPLAHHSHCGFTILTNLA